MMPVDVDSVVTGLQQGAQKTALMAGPWATYMTLVLVIGALLLVLLLLVAYMKKKAKESQILFFLNETNCENRDIEIDDQEFQITKKSGKYYLDKNDKPMMIRNGIFGWKPFYIFYNGIPCHLSINKKEITVASDTLKEFLEQKTLERLLKPEEMSNDKLIMGIALGIVVGIMLGTVPFMFKWIKV